MPLPLPSALLPKGMFCKEIRSLCQDVNQCIASFIENILLCQLNTVFNDLHLVLLICILAKLFILLWMGYRRFKDEQLMHGPHFISTKCTVPACMA